MAEPITNGIPSTASDAPTKRFDPWNSSSTGHQRAENRLARSTSWRDSRTAKLGSQLRGGYSGGARVSDTVGAGSATFNHDGRKENGGWVKGAPGLRAPGQLSMKDMLSGMRKEHNGVSFESKQRQPSRMTGHLPTPIVGSTSVKSPPMQPVGQRSSSRNAPYGTGEESLDIGTQRRLEDHLPQIRHETKEKSAVGTKISESSERKEIFRNLVFYINGSTFPVVSDHRLKYLIAEFGGRVSIALGRRSVTHVILGKGSGSGLAGGKLQKEIGRVNGCGVKYVTAEWVLESIKSGKRVPETAFGPSKLASTGQQSVYEIYSTKSKDTKH
ncbi:hypothetical protein L228DRAFT_249274 [Xylona heveae TC161]|uniref:BRCT domain-containing protein n=1 Tax=Xylona heveae (strain CBS 132557 / TC161) TaxID=1328760 RepID=A0A165FW21_XYLHT|nr:hypothetical protein L228DRAFT_249274 [Xylona heveae TC161]KZF21450.1 hypothetical protein L228DRAFT_249274 [Xylona heveae TC161]